MRVRHDAPPWTVAARTGAYWLDELLYGDEEATNRFGRYGLWLVAALAAAVTLSWTFAVPAMDPMLLDASVSLPVLAATGLLAVALAVASAVGGAGVVAAVGIGLAPALGYATAVLAAAIVGIDVPAGVAAAPFLLGLGVGGLVAGVLAYALGSGSRIVSESS